MQSRLNELGFQYRDRLLEVSGDPIGFYEREFYPFSNFSSFQVFWRSRYWPTSEHAYQAAHFIGIPVLYDWIGSALSADAAFKIARQNIDKAPGNWDEIKVSVMEDICWNKLLQHDYVQRKLMQSGNRLLVEDSPYDSFWGIGEFKDGRNELGKIWMRLRERWRITNGATVL